MSGLSVGETRRETFPISSESSRPNTCRAVSFDAVEAGQRGGVDADGHGQAGFVDQDGGERLGVVGVGQGLADGDVGKAGHGHDLTRSGLFDVDPFQGARGVELGHLGLLDRPVHPAPGHRVAAAQCPVMDPADGQAAHVGGGVEIRDQCLEGVVGVVDGGGDVGHDGVEERHQVGPHGIGLRGGPSGPGVGVEDGEAHLVLVGVEVEEQVLHLADDFLDTGVGPVHLVDHEDAPGGGLRGSCAGRSGSGAGALRGVHQQQDAVDHGQAPLHLAPEIGVAGGVHDGDLGPSVLDGRVLGQDGDALFAFEVTGVEDAVGELLVRSKGSRLTEHAVDQRGLAVVNVGHDRHVAQVIA